MVDKISETIKVYEKYAQGYCDAHFDINEIKRDIDFFIKNLNGNKILDIGCGPGRDADYFSRYNLEVTGIDLCSNFIKIASKKVPKGNFILMDMRDLNFPNNTFNGIWSCASFLHIPKNEAKKTLNEFKRVLKLGGLIYLGVKQGDKEGFVKKDKYEEGIKFFAFYNQEEFKKLVESCGFKILKIIKDYKKDTWINLFAIKE